MRSKNRHIFWVCCLCAMLGLLSMKESAATSCTATSPSFNFPSQIPVKTTAANGTLLTPWTQATMAISCNKNAWYEWLLSNRLSAPSNLTLTSFTVSDGGVTYNVFSTKTPGVGVAVGFIATDAGNAWQTLTASPQTTALNPPPDNVLGSIDMIATSPYSATGTFKAALVKIADLPVGTLLFPSTPVVTYYPIWYGRPNTAADSLSYYADSLKATVSASPITLVSASTTCTVTQASANQTVNLGYVKLNQFNGVGTSAGTKSFTVDLQNCYNNPVVSLRFSGTPAATFPNAEQNGILATTGTTTGIGVQLLDNRNSGSPAPIPLNAAWSAGTVVGSGIADTMSIPFAARLIQTTPAMSPGNISATATMQFTYQ